MCFVGWNELHQKTNSGQVSQEKMQLKNVTTSLILLYTLGQVVTDNLPLQNS